MKISYLCLLLLISFFTNAQARLCDELFVSVEDGEQYISAPKVDGLLLVRTTADKKVIYMMNAELGVPEIIDGAKGFSIVLADGRSITRPDQFYDILDTDDNGIRYNVFVT